MSSRPSWRELERVASLIADLTEVDPTSGAREGVLLEGLCELTGAHMALLYRGERTPGPEPVRLVSYHEHGVEERVGRLLQEYMAENGQDDPLIAPGLERLRGARPGAVAANLREELMSDREFYRHPHFRHMCREIDCDSRLMVTTRLEGPRVVNISLHRPLRDRRFSERERRLIEVVGRQAQRLLPWPGLPVGGVLRGSDGVLVDLREASESGGFEELAELLGLTDREREVARWVCRGLGNKQVARELGISDQTVKRHVSNLLRKTKAESRTELAYRLGVGPRSTFQG